MVAGRDVAEVGPALLQGRHRQAAAVDVHAAAGDAVIFQDGSGPVVARIFHRRHTPPQQLGHQAQQVLHPGPHHNLLRPTHHPPVGPEVVRQAGAQILIPLAVSVAEQFRAGVEQFLLNAAPGAKGKKRSVHRPGGQVKPPGLLPDRGGGLLRRGRRGQGPLHLLDKKAAALPGLQIPLRHQHLVGGVHGVYRQIQLPRQAPLAGKPVPPLQPTGMYLLRQGRIQLLIQGLRRPGVQADRQIQHGAPSHLIP